MTTATISNPLGPIDPTTSGKVAQIAGLASGALVVGGMGAVSAVMAYGNGRALPTHKLLAVGIAVGAVTGALGVAIADNLSRDNRWAQGGMAIGTVGIGGGIAASSLPASRRVAASLPHVPGVPHWRYVASPLMQEAVIGVILGWVLGGFAGAGIGKILDRSSQEQP